MTTKLGIKDWPEQERPREKLLARGGEVLSDAELLAIFLGSGIRGQNAVDLARTLLQQTGGLRTLLDLDRAAMTELPGIGPVTFATLKACLELGRRYLEAPLKRGHALESPDDTRRYISAMLKGKAREIFVCLFLDTRHRVISYEPLFHGTIDSASVYPREIIRRTLEHNAAAVIFAHNHPSGVSEPSETDRALTRRLERALKTIDVRVLDHIVVGDCETVSFAERGWL